MNPDARLPDIRPGDTIVTLTELRVGDIVRMERVDRRTVGLRAVPAGDVAGWKGPLFRIEAGENAGAVRLVQVRAEGPLN